MMRRRSFLGALLGAALPLPPLPLKPTIPSGFVPVSDYVFLVHPVWVEDLKRTYGDVMVQGTGIYKGEIGVLEGIRFIESERIK